MTRTRTFLLALAGVLCSASPALADGNAGAAGGLLLACDGQDCLVPALPKDLTPDKPLIQAPTGQVACSSEQSCLVPALPKDLTPDQPLIQAPAERVACESDNC